MIVIDEMHSASRGYLRGVCDRLGIRYTVLHGDKDPLLGELMYANPEPPHIQHCMDTVRELKSRYPRIIGVGVDTDSDRVGVVDEAGNYVMTNRLLPMLADYLLSNAYDGQPGLIIRNMVTTRMLDRVAFVHHERILPPADPEAIVQHAAVPSYHVSLGDAKMQSGFLTHVVPVGFKFIAEVMMRDLQEALAGGERRRERLQELFLTCLQRLLIAGEESNGLTPRGHAPDKDGLWGALLTLQMCAVREQRWGPSGSILSPATASWCPYAVMSKRPMSPRKRGQLLSRSAARKWPPMRSTLTVTGAVYAGLLRRHPRGSWSR